MNFTDQQKKVIHFEGDAVWRAVAGSGKTTTLVQYAKVRPKEKGLYLVYNKSAVMEAVEKFNKNKIENVRICTAHSLAFDRIMRGSNYALAQKNYSAVDIKNIFDLHGEGSLKLANHAKRLVEVYCSSACIKVDEIDYMALYKDAEVLTFLAVNMERIQEVARNFLKMMNKGEISVTHDFYLKKFQLTAKNLDYDFILYDEGQDTSACMLDVFLKQDARKIIVGDEHQQIYGWRGAVNSLDKVDFPRFMLTESFRFGPGVAAVANEVLALKGGDVSPVIGSGPSKSCGLSATLTRGNLTLLMKAIDYIGNYGTKKIHFEGNLSSYTFAEDGTSLWDILNLKLQKKDYIRDPLLKQFEDYQAFKDFLSETKEAQLLTLASIVDKYGASLFQLMKRLNESNTATKEEAEMIFSTAHKSKGMEYDSVTLADDFLDVKEYQDNSEKRENTSAEDINLLYVAATRAKRELRIDAKQVPSDFPKGGFKDVKVF